MLKTLLVYLHLLATAFALVELLKFDIRLLLNLNRPLAAVDLQRLISTKNTVTLALVVLWVTGIWFVVNGAIDEPGKYLTNQKLWMKVFTVSLLTVNGMLMHSIGFTRLRPGAVFSEMALRDQWLLLGMGVVSSVSWMFAAFLGIARAWNYTASFDDLLVMYLWFLWGGFTVANLPLLYLRLRHNNARVTDTLKFNLLKTLSLFDGFSDDTLWEFLHLTEWHRFKPEQTLIEEGKAGRSFYILANGEASVEKNGKPIGVLKVGDYFGDIAYVREQAAARAATVTARSEAVVIRIKSKTLTTASDDLRFSLHRAFLRTLDDRPASTDYQLAAP